MSYRRLFLALLVLALVATQLQAQVYKCKRGSVIAYQDSPCPKGTELGRITLEAPPVPGKTPSSTLGPPKPMPPRGPAPPPASAPLAASENFKCTRFNGSSYYSASLMPKRQLVRAAELVAPLAAPAGTPPDASVWVTDQCVATPLKEACDFYNVELDRVAKLMRSAGAAELKALTRENMRLRTISNSRCRR